MIFEGKAIKVGDDVDTDVIIPGAYLKGATLGPKALAAHLMEGIEPNFVRRVSPGDILVAGKNFGCGSSREHAVVAIQGAGISAVIARSFARIFFRNAINQALPVIACPEAVDAARDGERVRVDLGASQIRIGEKVLPIQAYSGEVREIFEAGGLVEYVRRRPRST